MSRKKAASEELDRELLAHINGLGLSTVDEYRDWCAQNGFSRKLKKHWKVRCRERYFSRQHVAQERLRLNKREKRHHADTLLAICAGSLTDDQVTQPHLQRLCATLRTSKGQQHERQVDRKSLTRLLTHLYECRAKFFDSSPAVASLGSFPGNIYIEALALVAAHTRSWLRPIEDWKPRSHSSSRQFTSLLRHLFSRYDDVPVFFDTVWLTGRSKEAAERRRWYLHVGRGQNIRHCYLPIALTKKMAHHFMQAPNDITVDQALRWGQIHGLGGDERLARAVFGTRLTATFDNDDFWSTVIRWFIQHPMLDRAHVGPIVDYLHRQRFLPEQVFVAPGHREETAAPQPNLTMKGRTPESLLGRVQDWHRSLSRGNRVQIRQWQPSGINGFEFLEGKGGNLQCWTIRELLSSKALVSEGRQLKHCVATYDTSCSQGYCSIWTMEVESFACIDKVVTIEVRNHARMICQIRGKANRLPNQKERQMVQRWADSAGLRIAAYI